MLLCYVMPQSEAQEHKPLIFNWLHNNTLINTKHNITA
jgi:hypothetical protein